MSYNQLEKEDLFNGDGDYYFDSTNMDLSLEQFADDVPKEFVELWRKKNAINLEFATMVKELEDEYKGK